MCTTDLVDVEGFLHKSELLYLLMDDLSILCCPVTLYLIMELSGLKEKRRKL